MPSSTAELVAPAYHSAPEFERTLGPEVVDLNEMVGMIPDPEQRLGLDILFALDPRVPGRSAVFEFAAICARQNLKTGLFKQAALGWLFLTGEDLVVWSAHEFSTAREAHRDMVELIQGSSWLRRRVLNVYESSNDRSIHLRTGARLVFKARTQSGGRGLSGKKVVLDEAFALQPSHMGALVPTMSAQPDPQLVYGSSAGKADSHVLRALRNRGRAGRSPRLGYLEWSAPVGGCAAEQCSHELDVEGCALDNVDNLRAANPLLGRRRANGTGMTLESVQAERDSMPPSEFARERLSWWDDPGAAEVFGAGRWEACAGPTPVAAQLSAVGVAVSVGLDSAAVVGVGPAGARIYAQVLAHGPGFDWVVDQVPSGVPILVDPRGPAAVLVPALRAAFGYRVQDFAAGDAYEAFAAFLTAVKGGEVWHDNDPVLTAAANGAVPRNVGDRVTWGRRQAASDITPIEAATLATWFALRPAPDPGPPPAPPQRATFDRPSNDLLTVGF